MKANPKVSVVMPVKNEEKYLEASIQSILRQTFTDFEFLIIDDNSTDSTRTILSQFARSDHRISVVDGDGTGIVSALNAGLSRSRGIYIARMDGDDVAMPERFAKQVSFLDSNPDCSVAGTHAELIDPDGDHVGRMEPSIEHDDIDAALLGIGKLDSKPIHPTVMMRAAAVSAVGGYRLEFQFSEDRDLFLRLAERGRLANIPESLLSYRMCPTNTSRTRRRLQRAAMVAAIREAATRRGVEVPVNEETEVREPSLTDFYSLVGWKALAVNQRRVGRKYARKLLFKQPLGIRSWRLLANSYLPIGFMDAIRSALHRLRDGQTE